MNPRIKYSAKYDRFIHAIDRAEFQFIPSNEQSRENALAALEAHALKVIAALEAHAGRPLTDRELLEGVDHPDDRTPQEKVAEETAKLIPNREHFAGNPYEHALELGLGNSGRKESRKQFYERKAKDWDAKQASGAAAVEFGNDAKRIAAVQHAIKELAALKYDPTATVTEIKTAETRLEIARTAEVSEYGKADREWRTQKQAKIDQRTAEIDSQIASLRERRQQIETATFNPPAPPPIAPPPKPLEVMPQEQYAQMRQLTLENDARRLQQTTSYR
jgi:hypothetical protein